MTFYNDTHVACYRTKKINEGDWLYHAKRGTFQACRDWRIKSDWKGDGWMPGLGRSILELTDSHQHRIASKLDMKLAAIGQNEDTRVRTLAMARWDLVRALREYQLFKHSRIFDPAIRSAAALQARRATDLKDKCLAAGERYKAHVRKWSLSGSDADWSAYERDLREIIDGIRRHLKVEAQDIRLLLLPEAEE